MPAPGAPGPREKVHGGLELGLNALGREAGTLDSRLA